MTDHLHVVATKREAGDLLHIMEYLTAAGPHVLWFAPEVAEVRSRTDNESVVALMRAAAEVSPIVERYQLAVHTFGMLVIPQFETAAEVFLVGAESYPFEVNPEGLSEVVKLFRALAQHHTDAVTCDPEDCFADGVRSFCEKLDLASGNTLEGIVVSDDVPTREKLEG